MVVPRSDGDSLLTVVKSPDGGSTGSELYILSWAMTLAVALRCFILIIIPATDLGGNVQHRSGIFYMR